MSLKSYTEPVSNLLTYGDCQDMDRRNWPNYVEELGLTQEHVPQLIQMVADPAFDIMDGDRLEVWAPVHAWRSLGQLRAEDAIAPLIKFCLEEGDDDEWLVSELPEVFSMIGATAIPPISSTLEQGLEKNAFAEDTVGYSTLMESLRAIAEKHPEHQEACIKPAIDCLEDYQSNSSLFNAIVIGNLLDLKVASAAPLIEKVYEAEKVDEFLVGTWQYAQVQLGLKQKSDFSEKELRPELPEELKKFVQRFEVNQLHSQKPKGFGGKSSSKKSKKKKK